MRYADLYVSAPAVDAARRMGWSNLCVPIEYTTPNEYQKHAQPVKALGEGIITGALLTANVAKTAKAAIESASLVIADGRSGQTCREAAESYDVDIIVNPELNEEKDLIDSRSSGLDDIMVAYMAERDIGYIINIGNLLHSSGVRRTQLIGRIRQNVRLTRKYKVKTLISCGARGGWDIRNPHDTMNFATNIGLSAPQARDAASKNPYHYLKRAQERADPNTITAGLKVIAWGNQAQKPKRKTGWY